LKRIQLGKFVKNCLTESGTLKRKIRWVEYFSANFRMRPLSLVKLGRLPVSACQWPIGQRRAGQMQTGQGETRQPYNRARNCLKQQIRRCL